MALDVVNAQVDVHLLAVGPPQDHLADAGNPLQGLAHAVVEEFEVGAQVPIGRQCAFENRDVVGREIVDRDLAQIIGQGVTDLFDLLANGRAEQGRVGGHAAPNLQAHAVGRRCRVHPLHARHRRYRLLNGLGDRLEHLVRRRVGVVRHDVHHRGVELRHQHEWNAANRDRTHDHDRQEDHADRDRIADRHRGQAGSGAAVLGRWRGFGHVRTGAGDWGWARLGRPRARPCHRPGQVRTACDQRARRRLGSRTG